MTHLLAYTGLRDCTLGLIILRVYMNMMCGLWAAYEVRLGVVLGMMCAGSGLPDYASWLQITHTEVD
jgi:hypothetical protein